MRYIKGVVCSAVLGILLSLSALKVDASTVHTETFSGSFEINCPGIDGCSPSSFGDGMVYTLAEDRNLESVKLAFRLDPDSFTPDEGTYISMIVGIRINGGSEFIGFGNQQFGDALLSKMWEFPGTRFDLESDRRMSIDFRKDGSAFGYRGPAYWEVMIETSSINPIPVPASIPLLVTALGAFAAIRRGRRIT